jgi:hypothetical protein
MNSDIHMRKHERGGATSHNSGNNGAPFIEKNYCGRSICFAACWFVPFAAKEFVI